MSWLPVDYAAKSIVELVDRASMSTTATPTSTDCPVYHILHPTRVPWSSILGALHSAGLSFRSLPRHEWLKALRASDSNERRNPSRKLLTFYESKYGATDEKARAGLCVDKTIAVSRWLREAPVVGEELVAQWVEAWRKSGFLPNV